MECNKEEALRAKQVAETRMQSNDFAGALRFAQKAQRLYPLLEGIARMLAVCEVHCAAEKKSGSEADWYAILQIETAADEITIKKQYRKLALLLHPDKNKFSGSEIAFKVIGEANRVLTDKGKRSLYDAERKRSVTVANQRHAAHQSTQNASFSRQFSANVKPGNASSSQIPGGSQPQQAEANAFWTMCPYCKVKYQYLSWFLHKAVPCQSCTKPFIAFKVDASGKTAWSQKASTHQKDVPNGSHPQQAEDNAFWTMCPLCKMKYQYLSRFLYKAVLCQSCVKPFIAFKVDASGKTTWSQKAFTHQKDVPNGSQPHQAEDNAFWTMCPICKVKYQHLSQFLHKAVLCQSCTKPFIAFKVDASMKTAWSQKASPHQKDVPNGGSSKDDHSRNHPSKSKCDTGGDGGAKVQANAKVHMQNKGREIPKIDPTKLKPQEKGNMKSGSRKRGRKCPTDSDAPSEGMDGKSTSESLGNPARRSSRPKQSVFYDENLNEDDSIASKKSKADTSSHVSVDDIKQETDDVSVAAEENGKSVSLGNSAKRSSRPKQSVLYDENLNKDDSIALKKSKADTSPHVSVDDIKQETGYVSVAAEENGKSKPEADTTSKSDNFPGERKVVECPDPEFSDFDKDKAEGCFDRRSSRPKQSVLYNENLNEDDSIASKKSKPDTSSHVSVDDIKQETDDASVAAEENGKSKPEADTTSKSDNFPGERKVVECPDPEFSNFDKGKAEGCFDRRSSRPKQSVFYDENLNEDDSIASKKSKADTSSHVSVDDIKQETDDVSVAAEENGKSKPEADTTSKLDNFPGEQKVVECPDPEFSDFDKDKAEGCFAAGQVWACYDTVDGMPRFYAKVVKVLSPEFRLKYTWFDADPDDDAAKLWSEEDLPIACGKYRQGKTDDTTDILMFSHQMHLISGKHQGSFLVYPRKGETWALFKNWDIKWSSEPEKYTSFDFDYVEVMSDFDKETGINVALLFKVKGFVSLFKRSDKDQSFQISKCDLYRFSHRIPSFKMTGKEKKGVPVGSFEFDTAALPVNAFADSGNVTNGDNVVKPKNSVKENGVGGEPCVRRSPRGQEKIPRADTSSQVSVDDIKRETDDDSVAAVESGKFKPDAHTTSKSDICLGERKVVECPYPEFSDFDKDKAEGCFAAGQVWACYDTVDSMPRFYAKVVKVLSPGFRLKYTWFEADPDDDAEILWSVEDLPIACGKYRHGKTEDTTDILMFSHKMHLIIDKRRGSFLVYPRKGETWALFKNWDIKWSSEPEKHSSFDFDYVEVLLDFDEETGINVAPLVKVKGFVSLFKRSDKDQSFQISIRDLYRFSHRIPSFKMTGKEKKGVPVGSFEFDTAALPVAVNALADAGNVTNPKNHSNENGVGGEPCIRRSPHGTE